MLFAYGWVDGGGRCGHGNGDDNVDGGNSDDSDKLLRQMSVLLQMTSRCFNSSVPATLRHHLGDPKHTSSYFFVAGDANAYSLSSKNPNHHGRQSVSAIGTRLGT